MFYPVILKEINVPNTTIKDVLYYFATSLSKVFIRSQLEAQLLAAMKSLLQKSYRTKGFET